MSMRNGAAHGRHGKTDRVVAFHGEVYLYCASTASDVSRQERQPISTARITSAFNNRAATSLQFHSTVLCQKGGNLTFYAPNAATYLKPVGHASSRNRLAVQGSTHDGFPVAVKDLAEPRHDYPWDIQAVEPPTTDICRLSESVLQSHARTPL